MIVMKFGGTSMGSAGAVARVSRLVKARLKEKPIVVVSAMGGITDLLLETGKKAAAGISPNGALQKIKKTHEDAIRSLDLREPFLPEFLDELSGVYQGILSLREFTPRSQDLVASFGERLSARILASRLKKDGVNAKAVDAWDAGFITTSEHSAARLLPGSLKIIKKSLARPRGISVITGFIGKDSQGEITTLGRGGSDLTASLIGAAVKAKRIEIWTDVSGIMTADPRVVPQARSVAVVSFQEAAELSAFGAKVLHPKTIEPAVNDHIPVRVKNTFAPEDPGTVVVAGNPKGRGLKAVTCKKGITRLNVYSSGMLAARGYLARVFSVLEKFGLSVDVVTTSEVNISLTLDNTEGLDGACLELEKFAEVSVERDRALVCLVGRGLKETPGIAGRAFRALGKAGINIEMISQGASQINLTFVVESGAADKAVRLLHREFFEKQSHK